jgi:predicted O-methyltransferase YrrM
MTQYLKRLPLIFFLSKKLINIYKKIIYAILFNKLIRRYYDRKLAQIEGIFLYLSNKKDHLKKNSPFPFNGQKIRIAIVNKIFASNKITRIYETGTFLGSSTLFMLKYKLPIHSCEISPYYYFIANDRLKKLKKIEINNSNSYDFLKTKLKKTNKMTFFYLDAHDDYQKNPLLKELEIIFENLSNFIILIDDFQVPHDYTYAYDSEGGNFLNLSYIKNFINKNGISIFFPKEKSSEETGLKRGSIYISKGIQAKKICNSINKLIKY